MKFAPALVVNFPPPHQEGSVLAHIISDDDGSRLGEICKLITIVRLRADVQEELAALRAPTHEKLFSFTVGNDVETSSGKSVLEICWETLERVQHLNSRIALHDKPHSLYDPCREQIERSGKFYYFLIRVAGIAGGDVAAAKFMDDPRNDCRVRDYLAEDRCPNYLIESITLSDGEEELCYLAEHGKRVRQSKSRTASVRSESSQKYIRLISDVLTTKEPLPRTVTGSLTNEEYAERHVNHPSRFEGFTNWCPTCGEYVALSHDGAGGISCKEYIAERDKKAAQLAAKAAKTLEAACAEEKAKRDRQRKLYMVHVANTLAPYFGAIHDRAILSSRGTVSAVQIDKLDTKMVRKLSQKKDAQTGRKMGVSKARELWNEVTKENTCQPQHTEYVQYQQELL